MDNRWQMEYRVRWWASTTKTVIYKGETEFLLSLGNSTIQKLLAEGLFNVSNQTGISGYTSTETVTAVSDHSTPVQIATNGGVIVRTC